MLAAVPERGAPGQDPIEAHSRSAAGVRDQAARVPMNMT
jgi:hypothetical protein